MKTIDEMEKVVSKVTPNLIDLDLSDAEVLIGNWLIKTIN